MRNKRTYTKTIAISESDLKYIDSLRKGVNSKKGKAGILAKSKSVNRSFPRTKTARKK